MLSIKKMKKTEVDILFDIALRAFQPDYDKYGVYPPLIRLKKKKFLPPRFFGKTIFVDDEIIGGAFVVALFSKGEIGAIFLDPQQQHKGYGIQAMTMIEELYPSVMRWKLETPAESYGLHRFYESLGYVKTNEKEDSGSGMKGFVYEKTLGEI